MEIWFDEIYDLAPGARLKMKVTKTIESFRSSFQQIDVFETSQFGKVLTLDGIIMLTDFDEFCYHEMIVHPAMASHPNPESVLVIGGGDGGALREILRHSTVKNVHVCDLDSAVTETSKKHFPHIAVGFSDSRAEVFHENGLEFVKYHRDFYDVVIVDSTDPVGPGEGLFTEKFYRDLQGTLRAGGICISQAESFFYHPDLLKELFRFLPELYRYYGYYWTAIPTYPSGMIGFTFLSNDIDPFSTDPDLSRIPSGLKYYSAEMHKAAFCLPPFAQKITGRK